MESRSYSGSCHCGKVRYEVTTDLANVIDCNCSICSMSGYQHLIVPGSRFRLLAGAEVLTEYTFNTGVARHLFCRRCGVKSFYVPRSNPDGFSVNARCLEAGTIAALAVEPFDGRNWENSAGVLRHLSSG